MAKCSRCGTSFDYEQRQGVCPKCCFYNRPSGAAQQDTEWLKYYDIEDNSYELPKQESENDIPKNRKTRWVNRTNTKQKQTKKIFPLGKVAGLVIVVCLILIAVTSFLKTAKVEEDWNFGEEEDVQQSELMTIETHTLEEAAEGITAGDITYRIGETKTLFHEGDISDLPSGEKCIGIWIEDNESALDYTGYEWERPYVYDGSDFRQMINTESLNDENIFIKNGIVSFPVYEVGYEDKSGYGIFFIDADASSVTLSLPCQTVDENNTDQVEYTKVIDVTIPLS